MNNGINFEKYVDTVEDFPKPGIRFYDISPLLGNSAVLASLIEQMSEPLRGKVDKLAAFDARGFLFAGAMAVSLGCGVTMLRKPNKLPGELYEVDYGLEYGTNSLSIQKSALHTGERVALVDDVIATGGTAMAGIELVAKTGAEIVAFCSVIDLPHLGGSEKIKNAGVEVQAIMSIES